MEWLIRLFTESSVAHAVLIYGCVIASGIWLGRIKIGGVSLGVTWILFMGLLLSYFGIVVNKETEDFLRDFGLILFVYAIGLQVGPGFFASLKKNALANNVLAAGVVLTGVLLTLLIGFLSGNNIGVMTGLMSGAVTNTPGLAAAQSAFKEANITSTDPSLLTLAYAIAYPFGVFGIILSMLLLKKIFRVDLDHEREFHRKLQVFRSNRPVSVHLNLENKQLVGQPLRRIFEWMKEPIVVSRMFHKGEVITPTPDVLFAENDVLLVVVPKHQLDQLKILVGTESDMDLKREEGSKLISQYIVVTNKEVTHRRLGDIAEMHQHDFTLTRLSRAGVEVVPHGNLYLQLGDTLKVVGTEEGLMQIAKVLGNSVKRLEIPDLAPIFMGIVLGVIVGSIPIHFPSMPVAVKIGMAGGPLIVALLLSKFGGVVYLNTYTTNSANLMMRELGISLFLASVGLHSGGNLAAAFTNGDGWRWIVMGAAITMVPLIVIGIIARKFFRKTFFETCGLLAGASTDPPALAFALKMAGSDVPSATYATVYPLVMILRIVAAELLILFFA